MSQVIFLLFCRNMGETPVVTRMNKKYVYGLCHRYQSRLHRLTQRA